MSAPKQAPRGAARKRDPRPHGHHARYIAGCRCDLCTETHKTYMRDYHAKRRPSSGRAQVAALYVEHWERRVLPLDDDMRRYRAEKKAAKKRTARLLAEARKELDRALAKKHGASFGDVRLPPTSAERAA